MSQRTQIALGLILLGILIFLSNYIPIFQFRLLWPVILIIIGLGIMLREVY